MGCPFIERRERVASFVAARDRAAAQPDDMGYALAKAVRLDQLKRARARADRAARNIAHGLAVVGALSSTPEVCICAAIRLPDGRVFRGHRHVHAIEVAHYVVTYAGGEWTPDMCNDQGFITSRNRYVGREEGMRLQLAAGIESVAPGGYRGSQLFSEDLY